MILAARAFAEGDTPPGVDYPEVYQGARGGDFVGPSTIGWLQAYADEMRAAKNPTGVLKAGVVSR
jgi:phthalate 4,5-dioxygenase oxygenase subunit